jgi:hypothetical protein
MNSKRMFPVVMVSVFICLMMSGPVLAEKPILIGCPLPLTGPYASDGEQMKMALELAAAEKNAAGGLLGHKIELKFGDVGGLEAEKIKAIGERLIGAGVNAVITGYDDGGVDTKVFGAFDIPYLHGNAMTLCISRWRKIQTSTGMSSTSLPGRSHQQMGKSFSTIATSRR